MSFFSRSRSVSVKANETKSDSKNESKNEIDETKQDQINSNEDNDINKSSKSTSNSINIKNTVSSSENSSNSSSWIGNVFGMKGFGSQKNSTLEKNASNDLIKKEEIDEVPEIEENNSDSELSKEDSLEETGEKDELSSQIEASDDTNIKSRFSKYSIGSSQNANTYTHSSEESGKALLEMVIREKTFSLSFVNLQAIPPLLLESSDVQNNIEILHLEFCSVATIPVDIINFMRLKSLNLSHNIIEYIPEEIVNLKELTHLNLYGNKIGSIPDLSGMNLVFFSIGRNNLLEIPDSVFEMESLEFLNIANNELKVLPNLISGLINLKELHLEDNYLSELPESICQLTKLQHLLLNRNRLKKLPEQFYTSLTEMKELNLSRNFLESESLEKLSKMNQLRSYLFGSNRIKVIPSGTTTFDTSNIEIRMVDFSNNNIKIFPKEVRRCAKTLIHLDLRNNYIVEINKGIKYLVHLRKLDISRNKLKSIPGFLSHLINIQVLKLSHNQIESIDIQAFTGWKELEELHLDHNCLERIPDTISSCKKLARLLLEYNKIKQLPDSIDECQLYHLDVSHNKLASLPSTISRCTSLRKLVFNDNLIESHPYQIIQLTSLEFINCKNNPFMRNMSARKNQQEKAGEKLVARTLSETLNNLGDTFPNSSEYYEWLSQKLENSNEQSLNEIFDLPGAQPLTCILQ